jgi:hypothetical protein
MPLSEIEKLVCRTGIEFKEEFRWYALAMRQVWHINPKNKFYIREELLEEESGVIGTLLGEYRIADIGRKCEDKVFENGDVEHTRTGSAVYTKNGHLHVLPSMHEDVVLYRVDKDEKKVGPDIKISTAVETAMILVTRNAARDFGNKKVQDPIGQYLMNNEEAMHTLGVPRVRDGMAVVRAGDVKLEEMGEEKQQEVRLTLMKKAAANMADQVTSKDGQKLRLENLLGPCHFESFKEMRYVDDDTKRVPEFVIKREIGLIVVKYSDGDGHFEVDSYNRFFRKNKSPLGFPESKHEVKTLADIDLEYSVAALSESKKREVLKFADKALKLDQEIAELDKKNAEKRKKYAKKKKNKAKKVDEEKGAVDTPNILNEVAPIKDEEKEKNDRLEGILVTTEEDDRVEHKVVNENKEEQGGDDEQSKKKNTAINMSQEKPKKKKNKNKKKKKNKNKNGSPKKDSQLVTGYIPKQVKVELLKLKEVMGESRPDFASDPEVPQLKKSMAADLKKWELMVVLVTKLEKLEDTLYNNRAQELLRRNVNKEEHELCVEKRNQVQSTLLYLYQLCVDPLYDDLTKDPFKVSDEEACQVLSDGCTADPVRHTHVLAKRMYLKDRAVELIATKGDWPQSVHRGHTNTARMLWLMKNVNTKVYLKQLFTAAKTAEITESNQKGVCRCGQPDCGSSEQHLTTLEQMEAKDPLVEGKVFAPIDPFPRTMWLCLSQYERSVGKDGKAEELLKKQLNQAMEFLNRHVHGPLLMDGLVAKKKLDELRKMCALVSQEFNDILDYKDGENGLDGMPREAWPIAPLAHVATLHGCPLACWADWNNVTLLSSAQEQFRVRCTIEAYTLGDYATMPEPLEVAAAQRDFKKRHMDCLEYNIDGKYCDVNEYLAHCDEEILADKYGGEQRKATWCRVRPQVKMSPPPTDHKSLGYTFFPDYKYLKPKQMGRIFNKYMVPARPLSKKFASMFATEFTVSSDAKSPEKFIADMCAPVADAFDEINEPGPVTGLPKFQPRHYLLAAYVEFVAEFAYRRNNLGMKFNYPDASGAYHEKMSLFVCHWSIARCRVNPFFRLSLKALMNKVCLPRGYCLCGFKGCASARPASVNEKTNNDDYECEPPLVWPKW